MKLMKMPWTISLKMISVTVLKMTMALGNYEDGDVPVVGD